MRLTNLLLVLPLVSPSSAWGLLGHRTVAILAARLLLPETAVWVRDLLGDETIAAASTWADTYSHTPAGNYSLPWHWIDAKDNPPKTCEVRYSRDCQKDEGCIVSALVNMTSRVSSKQLPKSERAMALKFIIHFLGDIHQPLHTEDLLRGGNLLYVFFDKKEVGLHHVWDTSIPEKHIGGNAIQHATSWADTLHAEISSGKFKSPSLKAEWSSCISPATPEKCALVWASESNKWICDYVLPKTYPVGFAGSELGGEYHDRAVAIVDELVAKAGWRLAAYLNMIVAEKPGLPAEDRLNNQDRLGREGREERAGRGPRVIRKAIGGIGGWWGNVRNGEL